MGGRPQQGEKPQRGHGHRVSPSSLPKPQAMRGDNSHEDRTVLGPKACSSWDEPPGLPAPAGARPARSTPSPGAHPRITHGALIHHAHAAPHAQHPPCRGFPAPTHSGTSSRAPSQRLRGISKFPGAQRAALPCSSPRQSIPGTSRCCKHCPATLQHAARAEAAGQLSKRGLRTPQMGQPHPEPRPDTHTAPFASRSRLPGEEDKAQMSPSGVGERCELRGGCSTLVGPLPSPPVPPEAASPSARGGECWWLPARQPPHPQGRAGGWVGDTQGTAPGSPIPGKDYRG